MQSLTKSFELVRKKLRSQEESKCSEVFKRMTDTQTTQQVSDPPPDDGKVPEGWTVAEEACVRDCGATLYTKKLSDGSVLVATRQEARSFHSGDYTMEGLPVDAQSLRKACVPGAFVDYMKVGELVLVQRSDSTWNYARVAEITIQPFRMKANLGHFFKIMITKGASAAGR